MNLEQENKAKRKHKSLTIEEWLTFFLFPIKSRNQLFPTKSFNDLEEKRFEKFGFEKKRKQANEAKFFGILFYINLILGIIVLVNKY
ncbi:hypothetical protein [Winogradskyella sp. SM1960]|uniref:hypothetical protein n=1 Tax=Winogradskyella sp. SM1960 TaxID=2865955 RepID=UPI001CD2899F|nr:hypothetical protein [Winogradskyella sp. SM1960]